jgi:hypothetical protein
MKYDDPDANALSVALLDPEMVGTAALNLFDARAG